MGNNKKYFCIKIIFFNRLNSFFKKKIDMSVYLLWIVSIYLILWLYFIVVIDGNVYLLLFCCFLYLSIF